MSLKTKDIIIFLIFFLSSCHLLLEDDKEFKEEIPPDDIKEWSVFNSSNTPAIKSDNQIYDVAADAKGNVWIATFSGGVLKYDGSGFKAINTENSNLKSNYIKCIAVDLADRVWVGTDRGASLMISESEWTNFDLGNTDFYNPVWDIAIDKKSGEIWFARGNRLVQLTNGSFYLYNISEISTNINSVFVDSKGNVWAGADGNGVFKLDFQENKIKSYNSSNSDLKNDRVFAIEETEIGEILFGTWGGGMYALLGTIWKNYSPTNSGLPGLTVRCFYKDQNGGIWVGTYPGLSFKFGESWRVYDSESHPFRNSNIVAITKDKEGNLWLATWGQGLFVGKKNSSSTSPSPGNVQWTFYNTSNSNLPDNWIYMIAIDKNADYQWFATYSNGVVGFNNIGKEWTFFNTSNSSIPSNNTKSIFWSPQSPEKIYIGTTKGLSVYNKSNQSWRHYLQDYTVWSIYSTGDTILAGSNGLLAVISQSGGSTYYFWSNSWQNMPQGNIVSVIKDSRGDIWVGSDQNGLGKWSAGRWTKYDKTNSELSSNYAIDLELDLSGNLWIATYGGGMYKFNGSMWTIYNANNSQLPSDLVNNIEIDSDGVVFAATGKGLAVFNPKYNLWKVYNKTNGNLPEDEIYSLKLKENGNIWLGFKSSGIATAKADDLKPKTTKQNKRI